MSQTEEKGLDTLTEREWDLVDGPRNIYGGYHASQENSDG